MSFAITAVVLLLFLFGCPTCFKIILFICFCRGGKEGEREGEKHRCVRDTSIDWLPLTHPQLRTCLTTQERAHIGNRTDHLSVHRPALNALSRHSQDWRPFFLLWFLLLGLPVLCWIKVTEVDRPVLLLILSKNAFSFSPLRLKLATG